MNMSITLLIRQCDVDNGMDTRGPDKEGEVSGVVDAFSERYSLMEFTIRGDLWLLQLPGAIEAVRRGSVASSYALPPAFHSTTFKFWSKFLEDRSNDLLALTNKSDS
ncbi:F-box protein [Pyrus ussuriensis x Pyrus communis]|uniref:F-box protein n=1 Tax=Pyrus ussuriensis x Pyrus communis TaxID=2448454 RepID=A0A5N5G5U9_9ROSA|nr:F-box protein [Pyrus ussuriensis x Pyrus communis]